MLTLGSQPKARIYQRLGAYGNSVQHKVGEAKFTLPKLGCTRQFLNEDMDLYVKRFHERPLDCCNAVDEETMVDISLQVMANE